MAGNSLGQSVGTGNRNQRAAPLMEPDEGLPEGSGKTVGNNLRRTICPRKRDATETPLFPHVRSKPLADLNSKLPKPENADSNHCVPN